MFAAILIWFMRAIVEYTSAFLLFMRFNCNGYDAIADANQSHTHTQAHTDKSKQIPTAKMQKETKSRAEIKNKNQTAGKSVTNEGNINGALDDEPPGQLFNIIGRIEWMD